MAPETFEPSYVEFLEPDIDKPEPLRIIKRGKKDDIGGFDGASIYSTSQIIATGSKLPHCTYHPGSPPERVDKPLRIQKKRKSRASVFGSSFGGSVLSNLDQAPVDVNIPLEVNGTGAFLKSELCRGSSDSIVSFEVLPGLDDKVCKGRKLSKAFKSVRSKSMNFLQLRSSETSLPRRKSQIVPQPCISRHSFEPYFNGKDSKALYPELSVIPEYNIVGTGDISLWVAVRVTGAFRVGCRGRPQSTVASLYDINIELAPGLDSVIEEVHCHNSSVLRFGESKMALARIKIKGTTNPRTAHVHQLSEDLIEELETQLGSVVADYLNVEISYKDSPFPSPLPSIAGVTKYSISSVVKARLTIPRLCGYPCSTALDQIKMMIEDSYEPWIAEDMIGKLNRSQPLNDLRAEGFRMGPVLQCSWNCSSDTMIQMRSPCSQRGGTSKPSSSDSGSPIIHGETEFDSDRMTPTTPETDPARKIWSDLRKSSRGSKPWPTSSKETFSQEQKVIRDMALRNRRSIGADTLRSMAAPSPQTNLGYGKRGVLAWSWGPPWW